MRHTVTVLPSGKKLTAATGECLLDALVRGGVFVSADCGGRGVCGKCRVRILSGDVPVEADGTALSCRVRVCGPMTVAVPVTAPAHDGARVEAGHYAAALDVGTTTLALCLLDPLTGERVAYAAAQNPQAALGADVVSRIRAAQEGKGPLLRRLLLARIDELLRSVMGGTATVGQMVVAANTVMAHLLLGEDPTGLGSYPFTPAFVGRRTLSGASLGLQGVGEVTVLPAASAFIGGDAVAGALLCGAVSEPSPRLLMDVGTNGELLLLGNGEIHAASVAAGPALEGASLLCGMGAVRGAIDRVWCAEGELMLSVIGGGVARGICGSGVIDLVALLLEEGLIDGSGALCASPSPLAKHLSGDRFRVCEGVYLTQKDVRQVQLSKAAFAAGIRVLLEAQGLEAEALQTLFLSGGLGAFLRPVSAERIGLLPPSAVRRVCPLGNSALEGAALCACDPDVMARAEALARSIRTVELGGSPRFSEAFMAEMSFAEGDHATNG